MNLFSHPTAFAKSEDVQKHVFIRVVSVNMHQIREKNSNRLNNLANEIAHLKFTPDIIAFQELGIKRGPGYVVFDFIRILNKKTSAKYATGPLAIEVNTSSESRNNNTGSHKKKGGIGIIYNKLTITEIEKNTHSLPFGNDRKVARGFYSKGGFLFIAGNTHYPRETELERVYPFTPWLENNKALISIMNGRTVRKTHKVSSYPQILAGDFNIDRDDKVFTFNLRKNAFLWSNFGATALKMIDEEYDDSLLNGNQKPAPTYKKRRVDYVWSKKMKIINSGVNVNNKGTSLYSDHNFIWSTFMNY